MSLIASIILFKWLENTAFVKLPFGQFGGSIAGFIGVFLILQNSYAQFSTQTTPLSLDLPNNYGTLISEQYGIGIGYPNNIKFTTPILMPVTLGVAYIGKGASVSNIIMAVKLLEGDELKNQSEHDAIKHMLDYSAKSTSELLNTKADRTPFTIQGIKGEKQIFNTTLSGIPKVITQIIIPHFEKMSHLLHKFNFFTRKLKT